MKNLFNLTVSEISQLEIRKNTNNTNCYIANKDTGEIYTGFILSDMIKVQTVCDVLFFPSGTSGRFIPRLMFKKIDKEAQEEKVTDRQFVRLSFSTKSEGYEQFWQMMGFLFRFKNLVDLDEFDKNYTVGEKKKMLHLDDEGKKDIFQEILDKGYSDQYWDYIKNKKPEIVAKQSRDYIRAERVQALVELARRLKEDYPETKGKDSWQTWIHNNNWLFGVNYVKVIQKQKINITGVMPDFLFLTADNFIDVLEIKLPKEKIIVKDSGHPGSYKWCPTANEAIGQVVTYIDEIDRNRDALIREIKRVYGLEVYAVRPRGHILIGKNSSWNSFEKEALRRLNYSLHGIELLSYTDLGYRGKRMLDL